jgi:TRAP-type mannitol/chloroaromatic compound transport system substrate-binding protein
MIKTKYAVAFAAVSVFSASVADASEASATYKWKMATPWSGGPLLERDAKGFANRVAELSEGRIKIDVFPGGSLGSALKVTDTVSAGIADVAHNYINYDYGKDATTSILAGHSSGLTPEEYILWMYQGGGIELYEKFRKEKFNVVAFPCSVSGTEIFLHSNKEVKNLEDFQGLKIRTSGAWSEIASRLGASTVVMSGGDIYSGLERGVIDATEWGTPEQNMLTGYNEVAQYIIVPGVHQSGGANECQINMKVWTSLSDEDQNLIRAAAKLNLFDSYLHSSFNDLEAMKILKAGPNKIIQLDQSFIDTIYAETKKWEEEHAAKNEWFADVLESQRSYKELSRIWPEYRLQIGTMGR